MKLLGLLSTALLLLVLSLQPIHNVLAQGTKRIVITFYKTPSQRYYSVGGGGKANVVKQYGRRLVLSIAPADNSANNNSSIADIARDIIYKEFDKSLIESIEPDSLVSFSSFVSISTENNDNNSLGGKHYYYDNYYDDTYATQGFNMAQTVNNNIYSVNINNYADNGDVYNDTATAVIDNSSSNNNNNNNSSGGGGYNNTINYNEGDDDDDALVSEAIGMAMVNELSISRESDYFQWNLADSEPFSIHVENIWKQTNGTPDITVAILDSGLAADANNNNNNSNNASTLFMHLQKGYDFISDSAISRDGDGRDMDSTDPGDIAPECSWWAEPSWHGTKMASILAANHETQLIKGVAQNVTVLPIRVLGSCGSGYANDLADAIVWASGGIINGIPLNPTPAKIISLSLAGGGLCPSYLQSAVNQAINLNSIIIAAAGNDGSDTIANTFPANCIGVISVGASTRKGSTAEYSNRGSSITAPGGDLENGIWTLKPSPLPLFDILGPDLAMGTSVAVPHVAGIIALFGNSNNNNNGSSSSSSGSILSPPHQELLDYVCKLSATPVSKCELKRAIPMIYDIFQIANATTQMVKAAATTNNCLMGSFSQQNETDPNICTQCTNGTYSIVNSATTCQICKAGTFAYAQGSSSCASCDSNTYCLYNNTPRPCPSDSYTLKNLSGEVCTVANAASCSHVCEGGRCPSGSCSVWWTYYHYEYPKPTDVVEVYKPLSAMGIAIYIITIGGTDTSGASLTIEYLDNYGVWKVKKQYWHVGNSWNPYEWFYMFTDRVKLSYYKGSQALGYQAEYGSIYAMGASDSSQCICYDSTKTILKDTNNIPKCVCNARYMYYYKEGNNNNETFNCKACDPGYFSSSVNASACIWCSVGKYNPNMAQTACVACAAGTYSTMNATTICNSCEVGKYGTNSGSSSYANCISCTPGKFNANTSMSVCSFCTPGTYGTGYGYISPQNCTSCENGRYQSGSGASTCVICSAGTYSTANVCLPCANTTYCPYNTTPKACPADAYTAVAGASVISQCLCPNAQRFVSTLSIEGVPKCVCNVGYIYYAEGGGVVDFSSQNWACAYCNAGYFSPSINSSTCISCSAGNFSNNISQSVCRNCVAGTYSTTTAATICSGCDIGKYSTNLGSSSYANCLFCTPGKFNAIMSMSYCSLCATGTYGTGYAYVSSQNCTSCENGRYQTGLGTSTCALCSAGTYSTANACLSCANTTYCPYNTTPKSCPVSTYTQKNLEGDMCTLENAATCGHICENGYCPSGDIRVWWSNFYLCSRCSWTFNIYKPASAMGIAVRINAVGGASASGCSLNVNYLDNLGVWRNKQGYGCGSGTYSPNVWLYMMGVNMAQVTYYQPSHAVGFISEYASIYPRGAITVSECICVNNMTTVKLNISSQNYSCMCSQNGSYISDDTLSSSVCSICTDGLYTDGSLPCQKCPPGSWCKNGTQRACPSNSYSVEASSECSCNTGFWNASSSSAIILQCISCPAGKYQAAWNTPNNSIAENCITCPNGTYQTGLGMQNITDCWLCAPGTYKIDITTQPTKNCSQCLVGTFSSGSGITSPCLKCAAGTYNPANASSMCQNCTMGTYSSATGATKSSVCVNCTIGTYSSISPVLNCSLCGVGSYNSAIGLSSCLLCAPGTYSSLWGQKQYCLNCSVGTYSQQNGSSLCMNCSAGTYSPLPSTSYCQSCTQGTYNSIARASTCSNCSVGTYSQQNGSSLCMNCSAGTYSPLPSTSYCQSCTKGTYNSIARASTCLNCTVGTYSQQNGSSLCMNCSAGTYSPLPSTSYCQSCTQGTYNSIARASTCSNCSVGTFNSYENTACLKCMPGTYNLDASTCLNCSAGTYSSVESSQTCLNCVEGTYNSKSAATSCTACGPGMYQTGTGMPIYNCTQCDQGKYQPSLIASACIQCPSNTTSLMPRSTSILNCLCLAGNICTYTKRVRATIRLNNTNIAIFNATQKSAFTQTVASAAGVLKALVSIERVSAP